VNNAGTALSLDADIGTIAVEGVAGSAVGEGRGSMDVVDSRGMNASGVRKAEECRASHAALTHGEEV
jgi:hypothetical protein